MKKLPLFKILSTCLLLVPLITLGGITSCYGQYTRSIFGNERMHGTVATVTTIEFMKNDISDADSCVSVIYYNREGEATNQTITFFRRRENNPSVKRDLLKSVFIRTYDKHKNLIISFYRWQAKIVIKHDTTGRIVNYLEYRPDGKIEVEMISKYRSATQSQTKFYDDHNSLVNKIKYEYDTIGNELKESSYNRDGTLAYIYYNTYTKPDAKGNWTVCTRFDAYKKLLKTSTRQLTYWE